MLFNVAVLVRAARGELGGDAQMLAEEIARLYKEASDLRAQTLSMNKTIDALAVRPLNPNEQRTR